MASIADRLISGAQTSVASQDLGKDVRQGVALAQGVENLAASRQRLEANKVELNLKQSDAVFKSLARMSSAKTPGEKKFHQNQATQRFQSAQPNGNPETLNQLFNDDELRRKSIASFNQLRATDVGKSAEFQQELAQRFAGDPEGFENAVNDLVAQATVRDAQAQKARTRESEFSRGQALRREVLTGQQAERSARAEERSETKQIQQRQFADRAAAKLTKEQKADTLKLSDRVIKLQITDSVNTLKSLNDIIPGGLDNYQGGDIPGLGGTGNVPGAIISAEGREVRARAAELRNAILKARSGGAVTPEESARLLEELGMSEGILPQFKSDQEFVNGLIRYRSKVKDILAGVESGFGKEVVTAFSSEFSARTGNILSSEDPFLSGKKATKKLPKIKGVTKAQYDSFDAATREELRAHLSNKQGRELTLDDIEKRLK